MNGIKIGRYDQNPTLDAIVYRVKYLDVNKSSLSANTIADNLFSNVDEQGDIFILFDDIVDHCVGVRVMTPPLFQGMDAIEGQILPNYGRF